jgi:hypothetical protein
MRPLKHQDLQVIETNNLLRQVIGQPSVEENPIKSVPTERAYELTFVFPWRSCAPPNLPAETKAKTFLMKDGWFSSLGNHQPSCWHRQEGPELTAGASVRVQGREGHPLTVLRPPVASENPKHLASILCPPLRLRFALALIRPGRAQLLHDQTSDLFRSLGAENLHVAEPQIWLEARAK